MNLFRDMAGVLALRPRALRALAARGRIVAGLAIFSGAFLFFVVIRNSVYAALAATPMPSGVLYAVLQLNVIQVLLFLSCIYVPAVIVLSNALAGDGLGLSFSTEEYRAHLSALFPLWGVLFLIVAPLQMVLPQFLVIGIVGISLGLAVLVCLLLAYTFWAIKELNHLAAIAAIAVLVLSWFTLPLFYALTAVLFSLPFILLIPLFYLVLQRVRAFEQDRIRQQNLQQNLKALTLNPQDADAHYQLGLIHLKRGNLDAAGRYFGRALDIDPGVADYHYFRGRVFETADEWTKALGEYEETYRLNPQYGHGDIFREVGKAYLNTGSVDKAIEFFEFFLRERGSDPEGRYWLAAARQKTGNPAEMRAQIKILLEQARSSPRFFRKENRKWIYRARLLLRGEAYR